MHLSIVISSLHWASCRVCFSLLHSHPLGTWREQSDPNTVLASLETVGPRGHFSQLLLAPCVLQLPHHVGGLLHRIFSISITLKHQNSTKYSRCRHRSAKGLITVIYLDFLAILSPVQDRTEWAFISTWVQHWLIHDDVQQNTTFFFSSHLISSLYWCTE